VPDFDAELYLRLIGERMLLDRGDQSRGQERPAIAEAASALVAVGVIAPGCVERVIDDYSFAGMLRDIPHFRHRASSGALRPSGPSPCRPLRPRRVVPCARTIEQPQATVHVRYVSLSDETTAVAVTWHADSWHAWNGATPPRPALTDDRGTTETAPFAGGGSNRGMHGRLTTMRPLATDTAWIELDGTRLELSGTASGFTTTLERLPEEKPAHRYLWQRIAEPDESGIEPAIDALVAAGVLFADDPVLVDVRAVLAALGQRGPGPALAPPPGLSGLPDPWRSLLARHGSGDGPTGSIVLGAVTPTFDDFSVAVMDLESSENRFKVDVDVAPAVGRRMPFDWGPGPPQLAWWARDDRGNHYLGHRGNWSFNQDYGHGLIDFHPALDPLSTRLELMPTGHTTRAVISFALPWVR